MEAIGGAEVGGTGNGMNEVRHRKATVVHIESLD
jgi:hypothetical protein